MNDPKIFFQRGLDFFQAGKFESAEIEFRYALELAPNRPSILMNLSATLIKLEKWTEAENFCRQFIHIVPDDVDGLINLGTCQLHNHEIELALNSFDRAIAINPESTNAISNKGNLLYEQNDFINAKICFTKALNLNPLSEESLIGLGLTENEFCNYDEGLKLLHKALEINPNNHKAKWNLALSELRLGNYQPGWELYESRWHIPGLKESKRQLNSPLWLGQQSIQGKSIFIYSEQGYGDCIQMSRYLPLLADMGAKVIFEAPPNLKELMKSLGPEITVYATGEIPNYAHLSHDFHCPIMSLPLAFKTTLDTIPSSVPYLHPNADKNAHDFSVHEKGVISIGLTWSGSGHYAGRFNSRRNLPFNEVLELCNYFAKKKVHFHCLHPGPSDEELLSAKRPSNLFFHPNKLNTFADTAALITSLDLVISIDTATAHLSGALAKPTILLIPNPPDFMALVNREDSPWYPQTKLLRQERRGYWNLSHLIKLIQEFQAHQI